MKKIVVSAPGKLMLLGEFAVVERRPCLVTAVDMRMRVEIELLDKAVFQLDAPGVDVIRYTKSIEVLGHGEIPQGARFVEIAVRNFLDTYPLPSFTQGLKVTTYSEFSSEVGFGSSSAATVCMIQGLSELFDVKLSQKHIFDLAYKIVLDVQGKGSGFDIACAVYGGTLCFAEGGRVIEPLRVDVLPLIVGYSGVKGNTVAQLGKVQEVFAQKHDKLSIIYDSIERLVLSAKDVLSQKDLKAVGDLMNENQGYLRTLGVSTEKLDRMIEAALAAGAYGAKLSGAGGGDCMIALAPEEKQRAVEIAIMEAGGEIIGIETNVEGVRIEK